MLKFAPIMPAFCALLLCPHYSKNYASKIDTSLHQILYHWQHPLQWYAQSWSQLLILCVIGTSQDLSHSSFWKAMRNICCRCVTGMYHYPPRQIGNVSAHFVKYPQWFCLANSSLSRKTVLYKWQGGWKVKPVKSTVNVEICKDKNIHKVAHVN